VSDVRPDRHALPEPEASPGTTEVLHQLRIAVGNEALAGSTADQDFGLAAWRIAHMRNECFIRAHIYALPGVLARDWYRPIKDRAQPFDRPVGNQTVCLTGPASG
jgi:hypothetical protein